MGKKIATVSLNTFIDMFKDWPERCQWFQGYGLPTDTKVVASEIAIHYGTPGVRFVLESAEWTHGQPPEEISLEIHVRAEDTFDLPPSNS